ncbi:MAG: hypothetical protein V8Q54_02120 [Alistipes senegalensis]
MQHLNEPAFSSKQIEEALFLSRSTLIRKVRALLDTTPNDYLRSKRLSIAAQLLAQNKCRISGSASGRLQLPLLLRQMLQGAVRRIARRVSETVSPRASGKLP